MCQYCPPIPVPSGGERCDRPQPAQHCPHKTSVELSRRDLLRLGARSGSATALGMLVGHNAINALQQQTPERSTFRPVTIPLAVVALTGGNQPSASLEELRQYIDYQLRRITETTQGAYTFDVTYAEETMAPDGTTKGDQRACYSGLAVELAGEKQRALQQLGSQAITLVVALSADSCNTSYGGAARMNPSKPRAVVRYPQWSFNAAHEIGHLLNPSRIGHGMRHELRMVSPIIRNDRGEKVVPLYAFHNIQELMSLGAALETHPGTGQVNEYASRLSIMGNIAGYEAEELPPDLPLFSAAELHFLDPRKRVTEITPTTQKHYLSYLEGEQFGVKIALPKRHALRQAIPEADTLFFGPHTRSMKEATNPETAARSIESVAVFATGRGGRYTALLDIPVLNKSSYTHTGNGQRPPDMENIIFADDELNFLAISGCDVTGVYVRFLPLDSPDAQAMIDSEKKLAHHLHNPPLRRTGE